MPVSCSINFPYTLWTNSILPAGKKWPIKPLCVCIFFNILFLPSSSVCIKASETLNLSFCKSSQFSFVPLPIPFLLFASFCFDYRQMSSKVPKSQPPLRLPCRCSRAVIHYSCFLAQTSVPRKAFFSQLHFSSGLPNDSGQEL